VASIINELLVAFCSHAATLGVLSGLHGNT
jgi:hypothetical protein